MKPGKNLTWKTWNPLKVSSVDCLDIGIELQVGDKLGLPFNRIRRSLNRFFWEILTND